MGEKHFPESVPSLPDNGDSNEKKMVDFFGVRRNPRYCFLAVKVDLRHDRAIRAALRIPL